MNLDFTYLSKTQNNFKNLTNISASDVLDSHKSVLTTLKIDADDAVLNLYANMPHMIPIMHEASLSTPIHRSFNQVFHQVFIHSYEKLLTHIEELLC